MKKLSKWAYQNPILTRWIIFGVCLSINLLGVWIGFLWYLDYGTMPIASAGVLIVAICVLTWYFPPKNQKLYYRERFFHFALYMLAFALNVWMGNHLERRLLLFTEEHTSATLYFASVTPTISSPNSKTETSKTDKKSWRKALRQQIKEYIKTFKQNKAKNGSGKIILVILLALLVSMILAGLSCSLACNGAEVFAVLFFVGGLGLIIWGASASISKINRKSRESKTLPIEK